MKKDMKKKLIIGVIILVVVIVVFRFLKKSKGSTPGTPPPSLTTQTAPVAAPSAPSNPSSAPTCSNDTVLKRGSKCDRVEWVQYYYNKYVAIPLNKTKLDQDGAFGSKTESAVNAVLGKKTTTWSEWKKKLESLVPKTVSQEASDVVADGLISWFLPGL